jgi:hypothetical protein
MTDQKLKTNQRLFYQTGGINICVEADIPIVDDIFQDKFKAFATDGPGRDPVFIRHHFQLPQLQIADHEIPVYQRAPWIIFKRTDHWVYQGVVDNGNTAKVYRVALINQGHTEADIYHVDKSSFITGGHHALTLFPTDQILLARVLADRRGCYFHAGGVIMGGRGFLFAGHSGAGKTTIIRNLAGPVEILCDDRIIVRKTREGFKLYGTWSHGDISQVSPRSAALKTIFFLEQSDENRLIALNDNQQVAKRLLALLIKPLVTFDWWDKILSLVEELTPNISCYILRFKIDSDLAEIMQGI